MSLCCDLNSAEAIKIDVRVIRNRLSAIYSLYYISARHSSPSMLVATQIGRSREDCVQADIYACSRSDLDSTPGLHRLLGIFVCTCNV